MLRFGPEDGAVGVRAGVIVTEAGSRESGATAIFPFRCRVAVPGSLHSAKLKGASDGYAEQKRKRFRE